MFEEKYEYLVGIPTWHFCTANWLFCDIIINLGLVLFKPCWPNVLWVYYIYSLFIVKLKENFK